MTDIRSEAEQPTRTWRYWTEPETIDVDGIPTIYRRGGQGPTLVYLHGVGVTRSWLPFHEALASRVDLVAPEHPGFGDTPRPAHVKSWTDLVLHYDAFLDALGLDDVHLAGHGLGAQLAANLAAYYPRRFASVTLLNPIGLRIEDDDAPDHFRLLPDEDDAARFNGRRADVAEQLEQEGDAGDDVQFYLEQTTNALLAWNPRYDLALEQRLGRIRAPFLSLGVERDGFAGSRQSARYAELVPGGRHAVIPGRPGAPSSHLVQLDQADETAAVLAEHVLAHA